MALRRRVEDVLGRTDSVARFRHEDRFWASDDGSQEIYGWSTIVSVVGSRIPVEVWFGGRDHHVAVSTEILREAGGRRRYEVVRHEWTDLSDLPAVLDAVEARLAELLTPR